MFYESPLSTTSNSPKRKSLPLPTQKAVSYRLTGASLITFCSVKVALFPERSVRVGYVVQIEGRESHLLMSHRLLVVSYETKPPRRSRQEIRTVKQRTRTWKHSYEMRHSVLLPNTVPVRPSTCQHPSNPPRELRSLSYETVSSPYSDVSPSRCQGNRYWH